MSAAPTVEALCEEFLRVARRFAAPWRDRFPHLAAEFESRSAFALFMAARRYVAKGPAAWARLRFAVYLKIYVHRGCQAVVARERVRHPVGFAPQLDGGDGRDAADRHPPADEALADAEQRHADLERVVGLLDALGPGEAEPVLRHLIDGTTVAALARECGRPHSTVHTRITRAVRRLRRAAGTEDRRP